MRHTFVKRTTIGGTILNRVNEQLGRKNDEKTEQCRLQQMRNLVLLYRLDTSS